MAKSAAVTLVSYAKFTRGGEWYAPFNGGDEWICRPGSGPIFASSVNKMQEIVRLYAVGAMPAAAAAEHVGVTSWVGPRYAAPVPAAPVAAAAPPPPPFYGTAPAAAAAPVWTPPAWAPQPRQTRVARPAGQSPAQAASSFENWGIMNCLRVLTGQQGGSLEMYWGNTIKLYDNYIAACERHGTVPDGNYGLMLAEVQRQVHERLGERLYGAEVPPAPAATKVSEG